MNQQNPLARIPSVDRLLSSRELEETVSTFGHSRTSECIRVLLDSVRNRIKTDDTAPVPTLVDLAESITAMLENENQVSLVNVINLTGTVLHTNLGRAVLPESAMAAVTEIAAGNSNLEFDLQTGVRGDRDSHVEQLVTELTGAEAVTIVNNNAAAVLLCLNTLAMGREVCISRGELVEIGGSFRIPEVMEKSGCILKELGSTNRTHLKDYTNAINDRTGLLMKVHTSNYEIRGFTQEVSYREVAQLAAEHQLPFLADLGSGTLVDLEDYGLQHEPTVLEVLEAGADVVTFSGDKLLGGPQAGIIAGKQAVIDAIKKNPLKRALRVDKMTLAALTEVLRLYTHPETLAEHLPTLRHLAKSTDELRHVAGPLAAEFQQAFGAATTVRIVDCFSQIGSGALPLDQLPSIAISLIPSDGSDGTLQRLALAFRKLPIPVIGRLRDGALLFDLRTLDNPEQLVNLLSKLELP